MTNLLPAFPLRSLPEQDERVNAEGAVQQFYERNVYPQWNQLAPWSPEAVVTPLRTIGENGGSVLVAGCGTARWACHFAASFPKVSVLAFDISHNSLRFASAIAERHHLTNISFKHVDLRTWLPNERFDLVECGGVLHHLEDPEATWARLVASLNPTAVMSVSLYSRAARTMLHKLRESILPDIFPGRLSLHERTLTDQELRYFRMGLLRRTWGTDLQALAQSPDLHSLARLRDGFFHPLEHEYDLLEIKAMLDRLGLHFIGMDADHNVLKLFREVCPGRSPTDLEAWHELEQRIPELFIGMYELLVVRC